MNDRSPIFEDKTSDVFFFNDDYNSDKLSRVVVVMKNGNIINNGV